MDTHAAALAELDVEIVAVADPRAGAAAALAAPFQASVYTDHQALLAVGSIDAVDIAIPHHLHLSVASAALAAGLHVFMDKPLATTLIDAELLHARAQESGRTFMLCHNLLFHPTVVRARELLADGFVGRLTAIDAWSTGWLELAPWDFRRDREKAGGGAWIDCASHLLYVLEDLVGPIEQAAAFPCVGETRLGGEDAAVGIVRFVQGATATLRVSYSDRVPGHGERWPGGWQAGYDFRGTDGSLRIDLLPASKLTVYRGTDPPVLERRDDPYNASFAGALREFVVAVEKHRPPRVTSADGLRTLRILQEAFDR